MISAHVLLLILALICFVVSAFNGGIPRINLLSLGLAFFVAAGLVSGTG